MATSTHIARLTAAIAFIAIAIPAAAGAVGSPQQRADTIRGQALNRSYGNAWTRLSSAEFNRLVTLFGTDATNVSPQSLLAMTARGEAMNRLYDGKALNRIAGVKPPSTGHAGFDWGDAGIGAGVTLGGILLAVGAVLAARRHRSMAAEFSSWS